jgi:hypothetical protein
MVFAEITAGAALAAADGPKGQQVVRVDVLTSAATSAANRRTRSRGGGIRRCRAGSRLR